MKFLIQNKEVYIVSYVIEAKNAKEALARWREGKEEEIEIEYLSDLSDYTKYSYPNIQEIVEV